MIYKKYINRRGQKPVLLSHSPYALPPSTTPNPSLVRRGVASRKSPGIFPALARSG